MRYICGMTREAMIQQHIVITESGKIK